MKIETIRRSGSWLLAVDHHPQRGQVLVEIGEDDYIDLGDYYLTLTTVYDVFIDLDGDFIVRDPEIDYYDFTAKLQTQWEQ